MHHGETGELLIVLGLIYVMPALLFMVPLSYESGSEWKLLGAFLWPLAFLVLAVFMICAVLFVLGQKIVFPKKEARSLIDYI